MPTQYKPAAPFNSVVGEGRVTALVFVLALLLGATFVFTQVAALTLLLTEVGARALPYIYIGGAIATMLLTSAHLKLAARRSFAILLTLHLGLFLLLLGGSYLGLARTASAWPVIGLPILLQALASLTGLAFWSLVRQVCNARQGTRLFDLIGAGHYVAIVITGFAIAPILALVDITTLLLLAALLLAGALGVLRAITASCPGRLAVPGESAARDAPGPVTTLLKQRYVVLLFGFAFLWWCSAVFIDNIFYEQAAARYPDTAQLAGFLGIFSSVLGVATLGGHFLLARSLIRRHGVRLIVPMAPLALLLATLAMAAAETIGGVPWLVFWPAVFALHLSGAGGFSPNATTLDLLYQPLPTRQRNQARGVASRWVGPLASGLAGAALLSLGAFLPGERLPRVPILLALLAAWVLLSVRLGRDYLSVLAHAVDKRTVSDPAALPVDCTTLAVVRAGVQSEYPGAVIYALGLLEQLDPASLTGVLPGLLSHPAAEVRLDVLHRIERLGLTVALPAIGQRLDVESAPAVRSGLFRTLSALGEADVSAQVAASLDDPDAEVRRGVIVSLLRHGDIEGRVAAGQRLLHLSASVDPADRLLAAQILGDLGVERFYRPLWTLLHDGDIGVRRAALRAAGFVRHAALWPVVLEALDSPQLRGAATQALVDGGGSALPALREVFGGIGQPRTLLMHLARVCGRIGGEPMIGLLQDKVDHPDAEVRTHVLSALSACGYRAVGPAAARVQRQIRAEAARATACLADRADIGDDPAVALLAGALDRHVDQARERIFSLLSFLYDARSIWRARQARADSAQALQAYRLELLDTLLSRELKAYVLPLMEELPPEQRLQRLSRVFRQAKLSREQVLHGLITTTAASQETWISVCALHTVGRLRLAACREAVVAALDAPERLVRDTAHWALAQFDGAVANGQGEQKGRHAMLSIVEKVLVLKTVGLFAATPDEVLAEIAALLEEVELSAGETLLTKGEPGQSMYVVVRGRLRVHDGAWTLNYCAERDVVGEMALLDAEPRSASVTAVEDTKLFRLEQEPFYELMADRVEVAHGIIRMLTRYVRARIRDVTALDVRVRELEQAAHAQQDLTIS